MSAVSATELQMLGCFGVEPELLDPDVPWSYNDAVYLVDLDGLTVSFAIQPSYRDVRIIVNRGNQRLFELNAVGVTDVRVIDAPGIDAVEVLLANSCWLRMQLRPAFEITQGVRTVAAPV